MGGGRGGGGKAPTGWRGGSVGTPCKCGGWGKGRGRRGPGFNKGPGFSKGKEVGEVVVAVSPGSSGLYPSVVLSTDAETQSE
jgi:hypothetical protein